MMKLFESVEGFQWDAANSEKNHLKHGVLPIECEEVFFNDPILLFDDAKHSQLETRYYLLGRTNVDRKLFIVLTLRSNLIRVISARDMSKKERAVYEKA